MQTISQIDTTNCSNFSYMFYGCTSLLKVPQLNTSKGTNFSNMFNGCSSLQELWQIDTANGTNCDNMLYGCNALSKVSFTTIKSSISCSGCNLSRTSLIEIFNSLVTIAGKTISISSNYGVSSLTSEDRTIATDKGWTIT